MAPAPAATTASATVLIVDDMAINRKLLSALARKLGFDTIEAVNGAEALRLYTQQADMVACILLDLQMPVLDGWSTAKALRSLEKVMALQSNVPIIACTACSFTDGLPADCPDASGMHQQRQQASLESHTLSCGVDMCLNKPLSLAQLTAALQQLSVPCPTTSTRS